MAPYKKNVNLRHHWTEEGEDKGTRQECPLLVWQRRPHAWDEWPMRAPPERVFEIEEVAEANDLCHGGRPC